MDFSRHHEIIHALQAHDERSDGEPLAQRVVDALNSVTGRERLELAEHMKLPVSARVLGRHAGPVLRLLIEDEPMRPFFADGAAHLWLELAIDDALPAALGIAQDVNAMTLMSLASNVDKDERWELLEARLANDAFFIEVLSRAGAPLVHEDDRYVDAAIRHLPTNPASAVRLMRRVATPRALEELLGIIERAEDADEAVDEALIALDELRVDADVVLLVLRSSIGMRIVETRGWRLTPLILPHRAAIDAALRKSKENDLRKAIAKDIAPPPRRFGGVLG